MLNLTEIKAACEKATPGPWEPFDCGPWGGQGAGIAIGKDSDGWPVFGKYTEEPHISNSFFCANSRQWVPELVAEVERLRKFIQSPLLGALIMDTIKTPTTLGEYAEKLDYERHILLSSIQEEPQNG